MKNLPPLPGPCPISVYLFVLLIFSKMLLALASCNSAQTSSSLRGLHWTQLCPHSWGQVSSCYTVCSLLPGVHFLALLPVPLTVLWPFCSPPWPYMSSTLCPSLFHESDGPQTPSGKGSLHSVFSPYTPEVESKQEAVTGAHTKPALASVSSI